MIALKRWPALATTCEAIPELQPRDPSVLRDLRLAHLSSGSFRDALSAYDAALAGAPDDLVAKRGKRDAVDGLNDSRQLVKVCDSILASDPKDIATWRTK